MTVNYKVFSEESESEDAQKTLVKTETKQVVDERSFCVADLKREIESIDAQITSLGDRKKAIEAEIIKIVTDLKLTIV